MKILLTNEELIRRIKELGIIISNDLFGQQDILVAPVLKGGLVFAGHLIPHLDFPFTLDHFHTSRYQNEEVGGELLFLHTPMIDLESKTVILIDDIYDAGITLDKIEEYCIKQGAKKVIKVVLLNKEKTSNQPKYVGFNIEDHYVYGFGLDRAGYDRNLPFIAYN